MTRKHPAKWERLADGTYLGPPPRKKIVHRGKLVRADGAVVALCVYPALRVIDLRRATWTNRDEAGTCPRCRRIARALEAGRGSGGEGE
jgi:hypothetical protein